MCVDPDAACVVVKPLDFDFKIDDCILCQTDFGLIYPDSDGRFFDNGEGAFSRPVEDDGVTSAALRRGHVVDIAAGKIGSGFGRFEAKIDEPGPGLGIGSSGESALG